MRKFLILLFLTNVAAFTSAVADTFTSAVAFTNLAWAGKENETLICAKKNLQLKNCLMKLGSNRVKAWQGKLFLNDMIERDSISIDQIETDQTKAVEWQFFKAQKLNNRWFIELGLWGPPVGEGAIESLWWVVIEIREGQFVKRLEKLIQKRKKMGEDKYKYDAKFKHELSAKNKKVHWMVHKEKGIF
jgi:hypothetical protein